MNVLIWTNDSLTYDLDVSSMLRYDNDVQVF